MPIEDKGNDDADTIFLAVGRALTAWERLDDLQGGLFASLVSSDHGAASAAYGMVVSPASRADMIIAAARAIMNPGDAMLESIEEIVNDIGKMAGRRNDIAHGMVSRFSMTKAKQGVVQEEIVYGHYLIPGHSNTRKQLSREALMAMLLKMFDETPHQHLRKYAYTAEQIDWYAAQFEAYRQRLACLVIDVQGRWNGRRLPQVLLGQASPPPPHVPETTVTVEGPPPPQRPFVASPEAEAAPVGDGGTESS